MGSATLQREASHVATTLGIGIPGAIDLLIVRELNGDVYFGEKGIEIDDIEIMPATPHP